MYFNRMSARCASAYKYNNMAQVMTSIDLTPNSHKRDTHRFPPLSYLTASRQVAGLLLPATRAGEGEIL